MFVLKRMTGEQYQVASNFFRSTEVRNMTRDYWNYVYTASLDYLDTGDLNILNSVIAASKLVQRVRVTKQLLSVVACHNLNSNTGKFSGKANSKKLIRARKMTDKVKERQEAIINQDSAKREASAVTFNVDQTTTRAVHAIAALLAHGYDVNVADLLRMAQEEKASIKLKEMPADLRVTAGKVEPAH